MQTQKALPAVVIIILCILVLTACVGHDSPTTAESTTRMKLLDVTSSAGQSGKYGTSRTTESYWLDENNVVRCFHPNENAPGTQGSTLGGDHCENFPRPRQLPINARLQAINMGTNQITQSIWDVGDYQLMICDHDNNWWDGHIDSAISCSKWSRPPQVDPRALIASLNSGQYQESESFWNNPDESIAQCRHDKNATGFLGLGKLAFGDAKFCSRMAIPQMASAGNFTLAGVTSDSHRPAETFWQNKEGLLIRCQHEKIGEGWFIFQTYHFGNVISCDYWRAPDPGQ